MQFNYDTAFCRNSGFINSSEQNKLKNSCVAVAGLGGTGSAQILSLARLGIGSFNIADLDNYELKNFNRQCGATMQTLGENKAEVSKKQILLINPEADVKLFKDGITNENIEAFLQTVDIVIDSLDFYCFKERFLLYQEARKKGIWVLTAPPLGFGFSFLAFAPDGLSFDEYFNFSETTPKNDLMVNFIIGLSPKHYFMKYLDFDSISVGEGRLPSVSVAPFLIAGFISTAVIGLLLNKYPPLPVPTVYQFDARLTIFKKKKYFFGMKGPVQKLKQFLLKKQLKLK